MIGPPAALHAAHPCSHCPPGCRRGPTITAVKAASDPVHGADVTITPPAPPSGVGAPYASYDLKFCLVAAPTTCFTKNCPNPNQGTNAPFTCTATYPTCQQTDTTCLRANTQYSVVAVGNTVSGKTTLESNKPTFTTDPTTQPRCAALAAGWVGCPPASPTLPPSALLLPAPLQVLAPNWATLGLPAPPTRSAPVVVATPGASETTATATITPPTSAPANDPNWTSYALEVCEKANPSVCVTQPDCPAASISACPLTGLTPFVSETNRKKELLALLPPQPGLPLLRCPRLVIPLHLLLLPPGPAVPAPQPHTCSLLRHPPASPSRRPPTPSRRPPRLLTAPTASSLPRQRSPPASRKCPC